MWVIRLAIQSTSFSLILTMLASAAGGNAGNRSRLALLGIFRSRLLGDLNAKRCIAGDDRRDLHGAGDLLAGRHDLLDKTDLSRTLRGELVAEEEMVHGVAPARAREVAERA